jgi:transaldolase/glucose-6-phosphate isomerase
MARISEFNELGQSIWSDYLRRSFIDSGELEDLIKEGLSGVTSNPTIFEKAISGSTDYDQDLRRLIEERKSIREIYETLVLEDISRTADLLKPVYESTKGTDGFVSVEVDPKLANDANGMIDEAREFFSALNRPNVMIKIPATEAGFSAIKSLIAEGINVNVTLIFSLRQYEQAAGAYLSGLERLAETGKDLSKVSSVASFFVSRVDTAVDKELEKTGGEDGEELKGKIGIANAKVAYARFREIFSGQRWEKLKSKGAKVQRVLWASTSTKNPAYPDTLYVDNLVGKDTINTLPPQTIKALIDHGVARNTLESGVEEARKQLKRLSELGIDFNKITDKLEEEGIEKFSDSMDSLFDTIAQKKERMISEPYLEPAIKPSSFQSKIDSALNRLSSDLIVRRIWNHDHTVWKPEPSEISNRLGWLDSPGVMEENVSRIEEFVDSVRASGYTQALLLGMGGSSLAPETFAKTFGTAEGFLELSILDSVKPEEIDSRLKGLDLGRTLFVVSTKSGNTVETLSLFKLFYNKELEFVRGQRKQSKDQAQEKHEEDEEKQEVGQHFVAITDPGSPLVSIAEKYSFRAKFLNDPNIGGRYSVLSYFGLVPAGLIGVDIRRLLDNALTMASSCESSVDIKDNPGAWLGAIMGEFAKEGRNKLTLVASEKIESLCDWIEQLLAESTGKEGKGILPVVREKLTVPSNYGDDRLFIHIQLGKKEDTGYEEQLGRLESAGFPVVRLRVRDPYEIGKQFFQWEFATAVAGCIMGINPFDQPNVESSKENSRKLVSTYLEKGTFPPEVPAFTAPQGVRVYGRNIQVKELGKALLEFIQTNRKNGSYVALQAYLQYSQDVDDLLQQIRSSLRDHFKLATTLGYGPRFLHSTGQLHKGDSGAGLFVQFTSNTEPQQDIPIPDEAGDPKSSMTFGILEMAEALGDRKALEDRGRSVVHIDLGANIDAALKYLRDSISAQAIQTAHSSS